MINIQQAQFEELLRSSESPDISLIPSDGGWVISVKSGSDWFRLSRARGGQRVWRSLDRAVHYLQQNRSVVSLSVAVGSQGAFDV